MYEWMYWLYCSIKINWFVRFQRSPLYLSKLCSFGSSIGWSYVPPKRCSTTPHQFHDHINQHDPFEERETKDASFDSKRMDILEGTTRYCSWWSSTPRRTPPPDSWFEGWCCGWCRSPADSLERVQLLDAHTKQMVRTWKGVQDAACHWREIDHSSGGGGPTTANRRSYIFIRSWPRKWKFNFFHFRFSISVSFPLRQWVYGNEKRWTWKWFIFFPFPSPGLGTEMEKTWWNFWGWNHFQGTKMEKKFI